MMKRCLIGFIIVLTSLFSFNLSVNALTLKNGEVIPDIISFPTEYYSIFYSREYNDYVLVFYEEQYITTVNGIENSYVQDNPTLNNSIRQFHNAIGGYCGSGNNPKVYFYYLDGNEWIFKGHDCYGGSIPYIYEYDTSIELTGDDYFTEETVNSDFVKQYYNTYIQYSTVNIFKHFYDGKFETPQLIYSTDMNNLVNPPNVSIDGYKMITVPDNARYVFISNVSSGSIYWLLSIEQLYEPQLFYVIPELDEHPYSHYIGGKHIDATLDPPLVDQDFDLSTVLGSKLIGIDIYGKDFDGDLAGSFHFWVPEDAYVDFAYLNSSGENGYIYGYDYIDPETGELVHVDNIIYDDIVSDRSFFVNFTNALDYFKESIITIFENVSYLFNNLPLVLQYFFMVIFVFILFIFLIRFIL